MNHESMMQKNSSLMMPNRKLLAAICEAYQIGESQGLPTPMLGGRLHNVYQFTTTKGSFILKYLNPEIINQAGRAARFRVTEKIAFQLSKTVSAVYALNHQYHDIFFTDEKKTVMIYPFIKGNLLSAKMITQDQVEIMGKNLAKIHQSNLQIENAPTVELLEIRTLNKHIQDCLQMENLRADVRNKLINCLPAIETIARNCQRYRSVLKQNLVVSHRDLDSKNVLWDDDGHEYLIDWESAGFINKTKDCIATGIYWSLDDHFQVKQKNLIVFTNAYQKNGGDILMSEVEAGLYGFLADWLTWLDFNITRMLTEPSTSAAFILGEKETYNTCGALNIVLNQFPTIINLIAHQYKNR